MSPKAPQEHPRKRTFGGECIIEEPLVFMIKNKTLQKTLFLLFKADGSKTILKGSKSLKSHWF